MDILSKLNVKSDAQFDGNLTVGTRDVPFLDIANDSVNINTTHQINATSEFFLGSGVGNTVESAFISSSAGYGSGSITRVNVDNSVACRLDSIDTLTGNTVNPNALVIHSQKGTLFESDILFRSSRFVEFDIGPYCGGGISHIDFNLFKAINTNNISSQNDIFTVYGRGVDHNGTLLETEFGKNSVKLITTGYAKNLSFNGTNEQYTGNYVQFQLSNDERSDSSDLTGNAVNYVFTDRGIVIHYDNGINNPGGTPVEVCTYDLIKFNGTSIFEKVIPKQKQYTNVEIPASCQLVNFGHVGLTEFKMIPPMIQLTDDENNIIHANIQFEQDACMMNGYNLMVGIEHDDVIPAGKYKLSVFGN